MRLDEAIRALKRPSGGGAIRRPTEYGPVTVHLAAVDAIRWSTSDVSSCDWEIVPPEKPALLIHDGRLYHDADACARLHAASGGE